MPVLPALYKEDNGVFTELPASIWTLVDPATMDITLIDGDPVGDLDGVANGFIEDPVAPAEVAPVDSSSSSSSGGCTLNTAAQEDPDPVFPLLMLAVLGYWFRRRRLFRLVGVRNAKAKATNKGAEARMSFCALCGCCQVL